MASLLDDRVARALRGLDRALEVAGRRDAVLVHAARDDDGERVGLLLLQLGDDLVALRLLDLRPVELLLRGGRHDSPSRLRKQVSSREMLPASREICKRDL